MSGSTTVEVRGAQQATRAVAADFSMVLPALPALPAVPDDAYDLDDIYDVDGSCVPTYLDEEDLYDELPPMSRIDALEWELWAGAEQDEAEREMLRREAPAWVFLPPGAELAAELETLRPQCESPIALIEAMKAAARMEAWVASIKADAMASFYRQRKAQLSQLPRPTQIDSAGRPIDPERSWEAEIAAALKLAPATAGRHLDTALHLTGTLTATHTALRCGALTWSKALAISEATRPLPKPAAQAVEAHVLRRAPSQTHRNLQTSLRRQVAKHRAPQEADDHRQAVTDRTCKIVPLPNGMAGLWVVHTADKIQQMWVVIQAMADLAKRGTPKDTPEPPKPTTGTATSAGMGAGTGTATNTTSGAGADIATGGGTGTTADTGTGTTTSTGTGAGATGGTTAATTACGIADSAPAAAPTSTTATTPVNTATNTAAGAKPDQPSKDARTAEQRRADVAADLFEHILHNGLEWLGRRLPDQHRRRPHIEVLIPITTLLGMNDDPCELTGYGPIPAHMARRIATGGTWRRLLTDPTNGTVLEASTTRHDPGTLITETLLARHPTCAWPGCNRTSRQCDRDHATPFKQTGQTSLTGLVPYCEYHHVIKDTPAWGWTTNTHPDGSITLTTPTGHRYTTVPPARGPITPPPTIDGAFARPADDPPPF